MQEATAGQARPDRVRAHTPEHINVAIDEAAQRRVRRYAAVPAEIEGRLCELDAEWDIERSLEVQAAVTALAGLVLGVTRNRKWLWLTAINQVFLLQHAVQGWCPPVAIQRRLRQRTRREIEVERVALKALRGDFSGMGAEAHPDARSREAYVEAAGGL